MNAPVTKKIWGSPWQTSISRRVIKRSLISSSPFPFILDADPLGSILLVNKLLHPYAELGIHFKPEGTWRHIANMKLTGNMMMPKNTTEMVFVIAPTFQKRVVLKT